MAAKTLPLLAGIYILLGAVVNPAFAQVSTLEPPRVDANNGTGIIVLDGPKTGEDLVGSVRYYLDDTRQLSPQEATRKSNDGEFSVLESRAADFGYSKDAIWLRLDVAGALPSTNEWRLHFRENFKQEFAVYKVDKDGFIKTLISLDTQSDFSERPIAYPELVAPLQLAAGETATILIRLWSEGASYLPINIETESSFNAIASQRTAKNFVSYGMLMALFLAASMAGLIFKSRIFGAYSFYSASALLFIMHGDGATFQYLWPNSPAFNSYVSVLLGSGLILGGSVFARLFLQTKKFHPVMDWLLKLLIGVVLAMVVASLFFDNQPIKQGLVLLALFAVLLFTASGLVAARTRFKEVRFYVLAWLGAVLAAIVMNLRHHFGIEISQDLQHDSMRVVFVLDAMMMGLAIIDRYNQLRVARHRAVRSSLAAAERNLSLTRRLENLEQQYELAAELAADKDRALVDTIHDLRQPLYALRANIRGLSGGDASVGEQSSSRETVEETFTYLENLVSSHLEASRKQNVQPQMDTRDVRDLALNDVLTSVHQMFLADAETKGLEFRFVETSLSASVEPLVLMRIVSNLVANAIKYTDSGKIVLGCRRRGDKVVVEVHDTGRGMSAEEFELARDRQVRLDHGRSMPEGEGYGLAIVTQLAKAHGFEFLRKPCPPDRKGTSLSLVLDRASAQSA